MIVPPYPDLLEQWHRLVAGDRVTPFEGPRAIGAATVAWLRPTPSFNELRAAPPSAMARWVEGGPEPL